MHNMAIRTAILQSGFKKHEIAKQMGIYPESLSRLLRKELPIEKQLEILKAVKELSEKKLIDNEK